MVGDVSGRPRRVPNEALTSFDFGDELLRRLARKDVFPNLKLIVFSGHSAGGQFVSRYEFANQVHEKLGVPVTYVVANPSLYAWPDANRPVADKPDTGRTATARAPTTAGRTDGSIGSATPRGSRTNSLRSSSHRGRSSTWSAC